VAVPREADVLLEHHQFVARLCRILLEDADEAEDAAQQVFLNAYRAVSRGVRPRRTRQWLAQIARNECRSRLRRAAAHPECRLRDNVPAGARDPADAAADNALITRLQDELADLPERQREALLLREIRGLSYHELATEMDESDAAVESLLQRARRSLTQRLIGPAFIVDWLRNNVGRLVPPGGTAEVATAGGAALLVAKLATVSATTVSVGVPDRHVAVRPHAATARVATTHVAHRTAARRVAASVHRAPAGHLQVVVARKHADRGSEHLKADTSSSGPGSVSAPEPPPEAPPPAPVASDNSGPGSVSSEPATTTISVEEHVASDNSGPGSSSSGLDGHDGGDEPEVDHSGHG